MPFILHFCTASAIVDYACLKMNLNELDAVLLKS